jgi:hypothetical protein
MIVAEDISGRRRAEEDLRRAHEELEQRVDARSGLANVLAKSSERGRAAEASRG